MGKNDESQHALFDKGEGWEDQWKGMPDFVQKDLEPWKTVYVHFASREDMEAFAKLVDQRIGLNTQSIWYPEADISTITDKRYIDPNDQHRKTSSGPQAPGFIQQVEALRISPKQWTNIYNMGSEAGMSVDETMLYVRERYHKPMKELTIGEYEEIEVELRAKKQ